MNTQTTAYSLRVLCHGEQSSLLIPLFEEVFGHRPSETQWAWKYADSRSFHVVCESHVDGLVGHAAVQFAGSHSCGGFVGQVGDVMVHPRHRGQMATGVFALMLDKLAREAVARGYGLCYGFPGERPAKLGLRLGIYEEVGRPSESIVLPDTAAGSWWTRWLTPAREISPKRVREIWMSHEGALSRAGRDSEHMCWRYIDAPHSYRFVQLGRFFAKDVIAVLKPLDDGSLLVVDWVGKHPMQMRLLQRLANHMEAELRFWTHPVVDGLAVSARPSPFVTIRLAKVPLSEPWVHWFDTCLPGDVDVY